MFDIYGSPSGTLWMVSRQATNLRRIPMDDYESLSHSKWECKYHVVFIPKCRRKVLYRRCCIDSCVSIWVKCFVSWLRTRSVG